MNKEIYIDKIDDYHKLIEIIYNNHLKYCELWLDNISDNDKFNLKQNLVKDIIENKCISSEICTTEFLKYMESFISSLDLLQTEIVTEFNSTKSMDIIYRNRIKGNDSIYLKLLIKSDDGDGKYPLKKCLNDLLGFRIISKNMHENISLIKRKVKKMKKAGYRIKFIKRFKKEYKAYHIYFYGGNNYCFPIELQLWDKNDEESNIKSHKKRKQKHLKWSQKYKEI